MTAEEKKEMMEVITSDIVKDITRNYYLVPRIVKVDSDQKVEFLEYIVHFICERMGVSPATMKSSARSGPCVEARKIYFHLVDTHCRAIVSQDVIGAFVGRDRSTVIHGLRSLKSEMTTNKFLRLKVEKLSSDFFVKHKEDIFNMLHPIPKPS